MKAVPRPYSVGLKAVKVALACTRCRGYLLRCKSASRTSQLVADAKERGNIRLTATVKKSQNSSTVHVDRV